MAGVVRRLASAGVVVVALAGVGAASAAPAPVQASGLAGLPAGRALAGPAGLSGRLAWWQPGPVRAAGARGPMARIGGAGHGVQGALSDVTALPGRGGAWAVGVRCAPSCDSPWPDYRTLIRHWNGRRWSTVPSPNPAADANYLDGVSAVSAADAWAVGSATVPTEPGISGSGTLIVHWNGRAWRKIPSPNPARGPYGFNELYGVSAVSPASAWAVGSYCVSACATAPILRGLILHWNGKTWSRARWAGRHPAELYAVSAVSARSAWAVGSYLDPSGVFAGTLILHWNGRTWTKVPGPSPAGSSLLGVTASGRRAWAVGGYCASACGRRAEADRTLILRWNGRAWSKVTSPGPGFLADISAISPTRAWAAGGYCVAKCDQLTAVSHPVILRWNGHAWSTARFPHPYSSNLSGIAAVSPTSAWAVGTAGNLFAYSRPLILHWNGKAWFRK